MSNFGIATAVALAGGAAGAGDESGEQPELFEADAALPVESEPRGKSGPKGGRPAGARNKSTEEFRQYFLGRYRSPLIGLAEIYSRSADSLARELHLVKVVSVLAPGQQALETYHNAEGTIRGYLVYDRAAAFDRQQSAMVAALPYIHQKQPLAIETGGKVAGLIVIGEMAGLHDAGDGVMTLDLSAQPAEPQGEQNQQVSEDEIVRPESEQSHAEPKSMNSMMDFKDDV